MYSAYLLESQMLLRLLLNVLVLCEFVMEINLNSVESSDKFCLANGRNRPILLMQLAN